MNHPHAISLIDVLMPPGNRWLMELSRRKSDLPANVRVVRFGGNDEDADDEAEVLAAASAKRKNGRG
jgi:hypothetical protein